MPDQDAQTSQKAPDAPPPTTPLGKRIAQLFQLRTKVAEIKKRQDNELKPYTDMLLKLGDLILHDMQVLGTDSLKVAGSGTVFKNTTSSATIADKEAFRRHIIGAEDYDLLDLKANTPQVREFIRKHGEPPPGVNFTSFSRLGVRSDSSGS